MKYNINDQCRIHLTKKGAKIINGYNEESLYITNTKTIYEEGDEYVTELWHLFRIFGDKLYMGCDIPFENNEIEIIGG